MNISHGNFRFQFNQAVRKGLLPSRGDIPLSFFPEPMYFVRSCEIEPRMNFVKVVSRGRLVTREP